MHFAKSSADCAGAARQYSGTLGGIALCQAAGCVVTGLRGEPVHTGAGGLLVAADQPTHATLLALIDRQFAAAS